MFQGKHENIKIDALISGCFLVHTKRIPRPNKQMELWEFKCKSDSSLLKQSIFTSLKTSTCIKELVEVYNTKCIQIILDQHYHNVTAPNGRLIKMMNFRYNILSLADSHIFNLIWEAWYLSHFTSCNLTRVGGLGDQHLISSPYPYFQLRKSRSNPGPSCSSNLFHSHSHFT